MHDEDMTKTECPTCFTAARDLAEQNARSAGEVVNETPTAAEWVIIDEWATDLLDWYDVPECATHNEN